MSTEETKGRPSYWWWFLAGLFGLLGGLVAWVFNNENHRYEASSMLLTGIASTIGYLVLFGGLSTFTGG